MKIGLLTTSFPRYPGDVAGCFVLGFAQTLRKRGHAVQVLAPEPHAGEPPRFDGIDLSWVPYRRARPKQRTFYGAGVPDNLRRDRQAWPGLLTYPPALLRAARAASPGWNAFVSHWALPGGLIASSLSGERPHLAVLHSADVHALTRLPVGRQLSARVARGASRLWFVAPELRDRFLDLLPAREREAVRARSMVRPMGVDPPGPLPPRDVARARLGLAGPTVLSMSRLVPVKGLDLLVRTLAGRSAWNLVIAGDGPERERLQAQARLLGTEARFVGTVRGAAKRELLAAADVLVAPSIVLPSGRSEGVPTAVLEALGCGLPVIASRVGGLSALEGEAPAVSLVPPGDPAALGRAIEDLVCDPVAHARASKAARRRGQAHRWDALGDVIEETLRPGG